MRLLLAALLVVAPLAASDWKLAGYVQDEKSGDEIIFYDAETLVKTGEMVRFWSKTIPTKTIDRYIRDKRKEKELAAAITNKISQSYRVGYLELKSIRQGIKEHQYSNTYMRAILCELAANDAKDPKVRPSGKVFWELNCTQKQARTLSVTIFDPGGRVIASQSWEDKWDHTSPDSHSAHWLEMFCGK